MKLYPSPPWAGLIIKLYLALPYLKIVEGNNYLDKYVAM
jgi:hypothetical protein